LAPASPDLASAPNPGMGVSGAGMAVAAAVAVVLIAVQGLATWQLRAPQRESAFLAGATGTMARADSTAPASD